MVICGRGTQKKVGLGKQWCRGQIMCPTSAEGIGTSLTCYSPGSLVGRTGGWAAVAPRCRRQSSDRFKVLFKGLDTRLFDHQTEILSDHSFDNRFELKLRTSCSGRDRQRRMVSQWGGGVAILLVGVLLGRLSAPGAPTGAGSGVLVDVDGGIEGDGVAGGYRRPYVRRPPGSLTLRDSNAAADGHRSASGSSDRAPLDSSSAVTVWHCH